MRPPESVDAPWTAAPPVPAELDPGLTGRADRPLPGVDNGYLAGYRIRFDEAGPDGHLRASTLLRYAQDIAWRHSEDLGFDRSWYASQGRWWVVRGLELEILEPVAMGRTIRMATAVVGHRRIWARRVGEARTVDGRLAAVIRTDWVIVDGRGRLVRIPADFGEAFPNPEIDDDTFRAVLPDAPADVSTIHIRVRPRDLDPMAHVNNAVYLDWIDEALELVGVATSTVARRRIRLEYVASAGPGDELEASAWTDAGRWFARIRRTADGADLVRAAGSSAT